MMAGKPRRSIREQIDEALANRVIDGGTWGDEAVAPEAVAPSARKRGSPPIHDWSRIDPVIDWYNANRDLVLEEAFVKSVRSWMGNTAPHERTILKRIQERARQRAK
jgi:hypothetical protein